MYYTMSVYDNVRWRDQRKSDYIVKGTAPQLMGYVQRLIARDLATGDPMEYHVFEINPYGDWDRYEWDRAFADPDFEALDRLIHPTHYETCEHGMSAVSCYGPNHFDGC